MNLLELTDYLRLLKSNGVIYFKNSDIEVTLSQYPSEVTPPVSRAQAGLPAQEEFHPADLVANPPVISTGIDD